MSKLKNISHILVAIILASVAGACVWYYVKINTPSVKVVVATGKLPVGTVISPEQVAEKDFPLTALPDEYLSSVDGAIGKTVISGMVFAGDVIRNGHISSDTGSLKAVLNSFAPGREAIDLPSETASGLRGVTAGDRVNVYTEITAAKDVTVVECVARESIVLKVPSVSSSKDNSLAAATSKGAYIIAVSPEEAKKVAEGNVRGKKFSLTVLPPKGGQ
ncbi:MAG: flagella basal body P-ring formation protein FlgA [Bacillota bacterium]